MVNLNNKIYLSKNSGATWEYVTITNPTTQTETSWSVLSSNGNVLTLASFSVYRYNMVITCFLKGTTILTNKGYLPIETLKKGDLVQTYRHGFIPIELMGKQTIQHDVLSERVPEQLYKCSPAQFPELHNDIVITGCHSILVDHFKDNQRDETNRLLGDIFVTDGKLRLPACIDNRTTVYEHPGTHTVYHFALENPKYFGNYGVYANGLLVETTSLRYLKELSSMDLFE
jgi:hypothetical protein